MPGQPAPQPTPPRHLDPIVREILEQLRHQSAAATIVLGGGVAFKHYLDYRDTHDLDAWWAPNTTLPEREAALRAFRDLLQSIATRHGLLLNERRYSDVASLELHDPARRKAVCSLQVASRDRYIGSPAPTVWPPLQIEALTDTLASKMTALIARGAPRDMLDVYTACHHGLATVGELWALWQEKNPALGVRDAQQQILAHVTALEARRPLSNLPHAEREAAGKIRTWLDTVLAAQTRNAPTHEP